MANWYLNGTRWRPLKKDGTPYLRITEAMALEAGAVPGASEIAAGAGQAWWMRRYFPARAVQAVYQLAAMKVKGDPDGESFPLVGPDEPIWNWEDILEDDRIRILSKVDTLMSESRDLGTEIHDAIADHLLGNPVKEQHDGPVFGAARFSVQAVLEAAFDKHGLTFVRPFTRENVEKSFTCEEYGGTMDFVHGVGERRLIIDWKTVEKPRPPRDSELAQMAAYAVGCIGSVDYAICGNIYISQQTGEIVGQKWWTPEELTFGWTMFDNLLWLWNAQKKFAKMMV